MNENSQNNQNNQNENPNSLGVFLYLLQGIVAVVLMYYALKVFIMAS